MEDLKRVSFSLIAAKKMMGTQRRHTFRIQRDSAAAQVRANAVWQILRCPMQVFYKLLSVTSSFRELWRVVEEGRSGDSAWTDELSCKTRRNFLYSSRFRVMLWKEQVALLMCRSETNDKDLWVFARRHHNGCFSGSYKEAGSRNC